MAKYETTLREDLQDTAQYLLSESQKLADPKEACMSAEAAVKLTDAVIEMDKAQNTGDRWYEKVWHIVKDVALVASPFVLLAIDHNFKRKEADRYFERDQAGYLAVSKPAKSLEDSIFKYK